MDNASALNAVTAGVAIGGVLLAGLSAWWSERARAADRRVIVRNGRRQTAVDMPATRDKAGLLAFARAVRRAAEGKRATREVAGGRVTAVGPAREAATPGAAGS